MSDSVIATSTSLGLGVRPSVRSLQDRYDAGDKEPLENLVRAWKQIQELPPTDPRSFFVLGGYHGEPFLLRGAVDALPDEDSYAYWGGYCNHGNVLFPTWHRVYVRKLEEALQHFEPSVMMPYWDETSEESLGQGIPSVLTDETFELDGETIKNPLRSFVLPERMQDDYWGDNMPGAVTPYFKPLGYETVRYPLSGLVGSYEAREQTAAHNATYDDPAQNTQLLDDNVRAWLLGGDPTPRDPEPTGVGIFAKYGACLDAPNYTVFSNTTSAEAWNNGHKRDQVVPLESPHNDIHLSVGGYDLPVLGGPGSTTGQVKGSNGDMGENNTAALDPIFFFHHCNVDRMFWLWQQQSKTHKVQIIDGYAGANSNDSQGPTPGIKPGTALTMKTPLHPFRKANGKFYTSRDCIDTEAMGYTYGPGSVPEAPVHPEGGSRKTLVVRGLNRLHLKGSFVIAAWATIADGAGADEVRYLGQESVLSRWNVEGCANCQTHLDVVARFPLRALTDEEVKTATFQVEVAHRGTDLPQNVQIRTTVEG